MKPLLMILGILSAALMIAQLVMGQLMVNGQMKWRTPHQHSGYLTVVVVLIYIVLSLITIASLPRREKQ